MQRDRQKEENALRATLARIDAKQANGEPLESWEKRVLQHLRQAHDKMRRAEAKPESAEQRRKNRRRRMKR